MHIYLICSFIIIGETKTHPLEQNASTVLIDRRFNWRTIDDNDHYAMNVCSINYFLFQLVCKSMICNLWRDKNSSAKTKLTVLIDRIFYWQTINDNDHHHTMNVSSINYSLKQSPNVFLTIITIIQSISIILWNNQQTNVKFLIQLIMRPHYKLIAKRSLPFVFQSLGSWEPLQLSWR